MGKWEKIFKKETRSLCPKCSKVSVVQRKYKLPGSTMGYRINGLLEKYSMNSIVEYECESCRHVYR